MTRFICFLNIKKNELSSLEKRELINCDSQSTRTPIINYVNRDHAINTASSIDAGG